MKQLTTQDVWQSRWRMRLLVCECVTYTRKPWSDHRILIASFYYFATFGLETKNVNIQYDKNCIIRCMMRRCNYMKLQSCNWRGQFLTSVGLRRPEHRRTEIGLCSLRNTCIFQLLLESYFFSFTQGRYMDILVHKDILWYFVHLLGDYYSNMLKWKRRDRFLSPHMQYAFCINWSSQCGAVERLGAIPYWAVSMMIDAACEDLVEGIGIRWNMNAHKNILRTT